MILYRKQIFMVKQELFVGDFYDKGIHGRKVLVVGHQCAADNRSEITKDSDWANKYSYTGDNKELMEAVLQGGYPQEDDHRDPNRAYKMFARLLSRNHQLELSSEESKILWKSLAFCNYLQVPSYNFNGKTVMGKDRPEYYELSLPFFQEYLNDIEPDVVIVWGSYTFPYICRLGERISDYHLVISLSSGKKVNVVRIRHPSRIKYMEAEKILSEVGL